MISKNYFYSKNLYIFLIYLSLSIFFFSTTKAKENAFEINNIEISRPFEINFDKNVVIDEGFKKAFLKLILLIVNTSDQKKIEKIGLNQIKGMIDSFSIKEEKFINEIYHVNLGVSFNKKKIFKYLEKKNIFPSIPRKNKFFFIPIIIDENKKDLLIFYDNTIYNEWENYTENFHLIEYILPTEDLEDLDLLKSKYEFIEEYDFKEITDKYSIYDSIILLIFKNKSNIRALSKIKIKDNIFLKNQLFENIDIENQEQTKILIKNLKLMYEDYWKNNNQVNTSIKLILNIKVNNLMYNKISQFEKILNETDLIYNFVISKFDNDFIYFKVIYNGTPSTFLKSMSDNNFNFDTQEKIWLLK
tara:strand:+ start:172 stop:1248 length:1077 start_codon:yes stop_codon:yes gene_type:complete